MINEFSLSAIKNSRFSKFFRKPHYDTYSFNKIPATIANLLGSNALGQGLPKESTEGIEENFDVVLLLFIDGFGFHFFEKYQDKISCLKRFAREGVVNCLSSLFPSTTAAHVTFIHTNSAPIETGIYEWYYYEPKVDDIIAPLPFRLARDLKPDSLIEVGIKPQDIFPFSTIYPKLKKDDINSFILHHEDIAHSAYSLCMTDGALTIGYKEIREAYSKCKDIIKTSKNKKYLQLYLSTIDSIGHREGIDSKAYDTIVEETFNSIEKELIIPLLNSDQKIAICLIADHGMVNVHPKTTYYLNKEIKDFDSFIKKNKHGKFLAPAGSCRDLFLHVHENMKDEAKSVLAAHLEGVAEVYKIEELLDEGIFGKVIPSQRFKERVGDLVILPFEGESVFWYERKVFEQNFFGSHGGLTPMEMDTIFAILPISN